MIIRHMDTDNSQMDFVEFDRDGDDIEIWVGELDDIKAGKSIKLSYARFLLIIKALALDDLKPEK